MICFVLHYSAVLSSSYVFCYITFTLPFWRVSQSFSICAFPVFSRLLFPCVVLPSLWYAVPLLQPLASLWYAVPLLQPLASLWYAVPLLRPATSFAVADITLYTLTVPSARSPQTFSFLPSFSLTTKNIRKLHAC